MLVVDPLIQYISVLIITVLFSEILLKGRSMVNIRTSRSWIEVDTDAITHNLDELSSLLNKNSSLMVVVKAKDMVMG
ncbi:MAG: hypothetical protein ACLRQF_19250 [Thomasclavelia ramosa]